MDQDRQEEGLEVLDFRVLALEYELDKHRQIKYKVQ